MWQQLLDLIIDLFKEKPWIREQCGFVLYNAIRTLRNDHDDFAQTLIDKLHESHLCKTPEGLAVWIAAQTECPSLLFPKGVWHQDSPLNAKETLVVSKVLREGTCIQVDRDDESGAPTQSEYQPNWSNKVHFAWNVIFSCLIHRNPTQQVKTGTPTTYPEFWRECVDSM